MNILYLICYRKTSITSFSIIKDNPFQQLPVGYIHVSLFCLLVNRSIMSHNITVANINPNMRNCEYAVRGEIYLAAVERTKQGKEVILTNVGNPQALGQRPITFNRHVMSLLMAPFLLDDPNVGSMFPPDAIERAKNYLKHLKGGLGAYSDARGNPYIRQEIATFISNQVGGPSNPDQILFPTERVNASELCYMP